MAIRLTLALVFACTAALFAFVVAGLIDGHYPFGPDERPSCGATPDGLAAGCFGGPLQDHWYAAFLWPSVIAFSLAFAVGQIVLQRVDRAWAESQGPAATVGD